jgi:hypothetical protein
MSTAAAQPRYNSSNCYVACLSPRTALTACRYCLSGPDEELERALHCDGVWLHALQYEGEGWSFRTPPPAWAAPLMQGEGEGEGEGVAVAVAVAEPSADLSSAL